MADNTGITLSSGQQSVRSLSEFGTGPTGKARRWKAEIEASTTARKDWQRRGEKVVRRYEDKRDPSEESARKFNILWANVQVLKPALYSKPPKPEVDRRYDTENDVVRVASIIMERNLNYFVCEHSLYDSTLNACVQDRLLPGQGVAWVRYDAQFPDAPVLDASGAEQPAAAPAQGLLGKLGAMLGMGGVVPMPQSAVYSADPQVTDDVYAGPTGEKVCYDYVHWKDFRCSVARTWEEVTWVGRRVYMTREQGVKRFGPIFNRVPLNYKPDQKDKQDGYAQGGPGQGVLDKAMVWEIWDKTSLTAVWVCTDFDEILDEKTDPLELQGFFPCPKPLLATTTTDSIIPVPDYYLYQDQAAELDLATNRISMLMQALKVIGVYDKTQDSLQQMLTEGVDNVMIPVDNWAMFAERGGIKGTVDFFPVEMVAQVLTQLIQDRNVLKQDIYEITGIADIVRGASVASETATAQSIKEKFAGIRINDSQKDIARFAADLMNMSAEIITNFFQPETLALNADIAPEDPDFQYVQPAIQLIKDKKLLKHRLSVSVDAITNADQAAEQEARIGFLTALGQFMQQASAAVEAHPELATMMGHIVLWGVRGFKVGRDLEGVLEQGIKAITAAPAPPKPDPAAEKAGLEMEKLRGEMAVAQQKAKDDMALAQQNLALEREKAQMEIAAERERNAAKLDFMMKEFQMRLDFMRQEMGLKVQAAQQQAATKVETAQIDAAVKQQAAAQDAAIAEQTGAQQLEQQEEAHEQQMTQQAAAAAAAPKPGGE